MTTMKHIATPTSWQKALRDSRLPRPTGDKHTSADQRAASAGRTVERHNAPLRQGRNDLNQSLHETDCGQEADRSYKQLKRPT